MASGGNCASDLYRDFRVANNIAVALTSLFLTITLCSILILDK